MLFIIAGVLIVGLIFYRWITRNNDYFLKKGVAHRRPWPFFGNSLAGIFNQTEFGQFLKEYYAEFPNERYNVNNIIIIYVYFILYIYPIDNNLTFYKF